MDQRSRTYGVSEALDVRCQDRILDVRGSLDSSKHICVVCHLHRGAKHVGYRIVSNTTNLLQPAFSIESGFRQEKQRDSNRVDKIFMVKADVGPTNGEFPLGLCRPGKENNKWLSPSVPLVLRRRITCGTHFEETKLVASITGRPDPESMSISWIFTPVGRISWGTMRLKQLEQALKGGRTCRWEQSRLPF